MASCEAQLLRQKIIRGPFTAKEIAKGALQDHLTQEDYDAPLKVNFLSLWVTCNLPVNTVQLPHFSLTTSNLLVVATLILLSLFQKRAWLAAQAGAIEASARELMAKLPEEIPKEEQEARKEGNSFIFSLSQHLFFTFKLN